MRIAGSTAALAVMLTMGGCMREIDTIDPRAPMPGDPCGASQYQSLIGQNISVLHEMSIPAPMRLFTPDTVGTTDYIPERLNIDSDARGVITRVYCG